MTTEMLTNKRTAEGIATSMIGGPPALLALPILSVVLLGLGLEVSIVLLSLVSSEQIFRLQTNVFCFTRLVVPSVLFTPVYLKTIFFGSFVRLIFPPLGEGPWASIGPPPIVLLFLISSSDPKPFLMMVPVYFPIKVIVDFFTGDWGKMSITLFTFLQYSSAFLRVFFSWGHKKHLSFSFSQWSGQSLRHLLVFSSYLLLAWIPNSRGSRGTNPCIFLKTGSSSCHHIILLHYLAYQPLPLDRSTCGSDSNTAEQFLIESIIFVLHQHKFYCLLLQKLHNFREFQVRRWCSIGKYELCESVHTQFTITSSGIYQVDV